jgi:hypothetical protein
LQDALDNEPVEEKDENSLLTTVDPQFGHTTVSSVAFL